MRLAAVALFVVMQTAEASQLNSNEQRLLEAESAFRHGCALRHDTAQARQHFARAAAIYDDLWQLGIRNSALALNRARSHRLAGDLPHAIAAYQAGLAVVRNDRALQSELSDVRDAVAYPHDGELAAICRPTLRRTIGARMSPHEALILAGILWWIACLSFTRYRMTRTIYWAIVCGVCGLCLVLMGGLWWHDQRHRDTRPLIIVNAEVDFRRGNGPSYPPRLSSVLPRGVEGRELTRRGGWVQVELANGAMGWLPESTVLTVRTD